MLKKSKIQIKLEKLETIMCAIQDFYFELEKDNEEEKILNMINNLFGGFVQLDNFWKMIFKKENDEWEQLKSQFKILKFDNNGNCVNL